MNNRRIPRGPLAPAICVLLAGCMVGPAYRAPDGARLGVPSTYAPPVTVVPSPASGDPHAGQSVDLASWWRQFNDPLLTQVVSEATAGNLDIAQSRARLFEAREARIQAHGDLLPSLTGTAGAGQNFTSGSSSPLPVGVPNSSPASAIQTGTSSSRTQWSVGLDASWQADLFGGVRQSIAAARAEEAAAGFDLEAVRTSVAAEVATNYINARLAQARLTIARNTLSTQDDNLQIAKWRVQAGLVSALDVEQARSQRAQTAAIIPSLQTSYLQAVARLGVLSGQPPAALRAQMEEVRPIPRGPARIAVGIPADTLRRRPDVRSAERHLAAATARIGVARAALYPALSITGNLTSDAASIASLGRLITGGLFAQLAQTIFDAGKRASEVRSARAATDLAFANYKQTVLAGLEDVENAVQALEAAKAREGELAIAVGASSNAAIYARAQYRAGLIDFISLLQTEQALLSARDQLASAQADESLALVQLYVALGGGWQPGDPTILESVPNE